MKWALTGVAVSAALVLAGCTPAQQRGFLPEGSTNATEHTPGITSLWVNSWIVLLGVGLITWGLILWATIAYRRRKGQTGLPVQLRYNMPIETFFTVVPVMLIVAFFGFTATEMTKIETRYAEPENVVEVIGKRWSWDFNYLSDDVFFQGIQVQTDDSGSAIPETMPVLYLPVDKKTEIRIETRDVIHSFWIVEFLYKKDMIPGQTNYISVTPTETGTFMGKCAELCGEYHSMMLFEVRVVEQAEYDAYVKAQREAGFEGSVGLEYNPLQEEFFGDQAEAQNKHTAEAKA
ncbi:MAG: cytochrome c oxidase subunit II [Actinobacteria bacterium]|jgi:cytochrome c oxidase subunit 2|nr:cytochrome c oxidase subunit II [Actinomycetota bacterium]